MDSNRAHRGLSDGGVTSVQFLLASGLGLLLFLVFANLVVVQYGRGAVRSALDQGARVGAVSASAAECHQRAGDVLGQLLGGGMGDGVAITCEVGESVVTASGRVVFVSWTPFAPDFVVDMTAQATRELPP
ncbi:MAG TPA: hypothetical protein VLA91_06065 [Acidimicrobiia bacterium]|nr:hypothetical protein [Acidimicrobiia bacterium]